MDIDVSVLSRAQFGFTLAFHILFPTLTIGLSGFLVILETLWLWTRNDAYRRLLRFWVKLFALSFGVGVVSGIVLSFEFGTNFARFSDATGAVLGPLLSYEVLTAFFLEASFLGVMLFGWRRVPEWLHFLSTIMVAAGTLLSAFWILSANSWMHTPAGYRLHDGIFEPVDWWAIVFNPSFPYRLAHMLLASYLTSAVVIMSVSAWQVLKGVHAAVARRAFVVALVSAAIFAPLQIFVGDLHGLEVKRDQPMKVAAMEGLWQTTKGAPLLLFAIPDQDAERNRAEVAIPKGASLVLTHDVDGEVLGLNEVAAQDRPFVPLVFFAFRVMVAVGFGLLGLVWLGVLLLALRRVFAQRWYLRLATAALPFGFVAVIAGWIVTEVGRQPWVVYGLMRTVDAATRLLPEEVATTLAVFVGIYGLLLPTYLYFCWRVARKGAVEVEPPEAKPAQPRTAWHGAD